MTQFHLPKFPLHRGAAAAVLLAVMACAHAQDVDPLEVPPAGGWKFTAGAGVVSGPEYPGSDQQKTRVVPLLGASYGRFFIGGMPGGGPLGVGAYLLRDRNWQLGVGLGGGIGKVRKESDDSRLAGLGDIKSTTQASVFGSYRLGWAALRGTVSTDIGGKDQGTHASLELEGRYALLPALTLTGGPGLTWTDRKHAQTFYGVSAAQSASSGKPQYSADGGISNLRLSVGLDYGISRQWSLGTRVTAGKLRGSAADSPITRDASPVSVGVFSAYRF